MSSESPSANPVGSAPVVLRNRYELGERLADGTFFYTHRGRELSSGRTVAIKVLRPEFANDEAFSSRLLSEAQSVTSLRHPSIAEVLEAWQERGTVVIVTEWVRGINLKERIKRVAPFPLAVAMDILLSCADALNYAHENGYVHGDIRPDNIIITPDGRVKITDFGLGSSLSSSGRIQMTALAQAAYYTAPEVTQGRVPDSRSDTYSLGCVLYEMLTGNVPFEAETPVAVAARHLHDAPPSPKAANPAIPPAVDGITLKCLQKDPRSRYVTLEGLLRDINAVREALRNDRPLNWSPIKPAPEPEPVPQKTRPRAVKPAPPPREERPQPEAEGGPSFKLILALGILILMMFAGGFGAMMYLTQTPDQVTVPADLVGMTEAEASKVLGRLGLVPQVRRDFNDRVVEGKVYDTDPKGTSEVRAGKSVVLWVSQGTQPVTVPDVVGKELAAAQKELQGAGFSLSEAKEEFSEVIPKGEVMAQVPIGGSQAAKKSSVSLVVSKGKEPVTEMQPVDVEPTTEITPPEADPGTSGTASGPEREFEISFPLSTRSEGAQHVRMVVRHEDGSEETQYDRDHMPGDQVSHTVAVRGAEGKCQIRVYLNDRLIRRENR